MERLSTKTKKKRIVHICCTVQLTDPYFYVPRPALCLFFPHMFRRSSQISSSWVLPLCTCMCDLCEIKLLERKTEDEHNRTICSRCCDYMKPYNKIQAILFSKDSVMLLLIYSTMCCAGKVFFSPLKKVLYCVLNRKANGKHLTSFFILTLL